MPTRFNDFGNKQNETVLAKAAITYFDKLSEDPNYGP